MDLNSTEEWRKVAPTGQPIITPSGVQQGVREKVGSVATTGKAKFTDLKDKIYSKAELAQQKVIAATESIAAKIKAFNQSLTSSISKLSLFSEALLTAIKGLNALATAAGKGTVKDSHVRESVRNLNDRVVSDSAIDQKAATTAQLKRDRGVAAFATIDRLSQPTGQHMPVSGPVADIAKQAHKAELKTVAAKEKAAQAAAKLAQNHQGLTQRVRDAIKAKHNEIKASSQSVGAMKSVTMAAGEVAKAFLKVGVMASTTGPAVLAGGAMAGLNSAKNAAGGFGNLAKGAGSMAAWMAIPAVAMGAWSKNKENNALQDELPNTFAKLSDGMNAYNEALGLATTAVGSFTFAINQSKGQNQSISDVHANRRLARMDARGKEEYTNPNVENLNNVAMGKEWFNAQKGQLTGQSYHSILTDLYKRFTPAEVEEIVGDFNPKKQTQDTNFMPSGALQNNLENVQKRSGFKETANQYYEKLLGEEGKRTPYGAPAYAVNEFLKILPGNIDVADFASNVLTGHLANDPEITAQNQVLIDSVLTKTNNFMENRDPGDGAN